MKTVKKTLLKNTKNQLESTRKLRKKMQNTTITYKKH